MWVFHEESFTFQKHLDEVTKLKASNATYVQLHAWLCHDDKPCNGCGAIDDPEKFAAFQKVYPYKEHVWPYDPEFDYEYKLPIDWE